MRPRHTGSRFPAGVGRVLGRGLAAGILASAPITAVASDVRVTSRTVGEAYVVAVPGTGGELLRRRRLVQYVNLGAYDLLRPRDPDEAVRAPEDGQLRIQTSLRIRHDFGSYTQAATGDAEPLVGSLDDRQIDLMFGYLEGQRLGGVVDMRVGRQFEMTGLDWYVFDGAWVRVRTPIHVAPEVFAGLQVDGSDVFGYPTHEPDGTQGTVSDTVLNPMVGAGFSMTDIPWMDARFAYRRTWSPGEQDRALENDTPGVDQSLVGASMALRLLGGRLSPHGAIRYNVGMHRVDDVTAGIGFQPTPRHHLRASYIRAFPAFDLDSIFNVFAMNPFEDVRVVYEVRPSTRWRLHARGQMRIFREETTAGGLDPGDRLRPGYGGGVGASYFRRRTALRIDGFGLGGEGGFRAGGLVESRTHVWWDRIALDGRAYYTHYRDELSKGRKGYSLAFQAGTNIRLYHGVYLHLLAEELLTPYYRSALRALGVLSVDWGFRVGQR